MCKSLVPFILTKNNIKVEPQREREKERYIVVVKAWPHHNEGCGRREETMFRIICDNVFINYKMADFTVQILVQIIPEAN